MMYNELLTLEQSSTQGEIKWQLNRDLTLEGYKTFSDGRLVPFSRVIGRMDHEGDAKLFCVARDLASDLIYHKDAIQLLVALVEDSFKEARALSAKGVLSEEVAWDHSETKRRLSTLRRNIL